MVKTKSEYLIEEYSMAKHAKDKYQGDTAKGYVAKRESQPKWIAENEIVERMLHAVPNGSRVLDCPIGTGRFIPLYECRCFHVLGIDINQDMLDEANKQITVTEGEWEPNIALRIGDIRDLDLPDSVCDVAVCIRMLRWLDVDDVKLALRELQRVSRKWVIFNARIEAHPYARPMPLLVESLSPGWKIELNKEIEPHYVMFRLKYEESDNAV